MSNLNHVTVLGSGVLGGQIAWHSAFKGKQVTVYDIDADALRRCRASHEHYAAIYLNELGASADDIERTRGRLSFATDLAAAVDEVDLVIEAVPEVPEIKTALYQEMAPLLAKHTVIASNSSTFLPSEFADATGRPDKFCALHYANLIWIMNLAEIMAHPGTSQATLTQLTEFAIETGMVPIPVLKEQHGYVLNSWFVSLINAAQSLVTNGIASPEMVDRTFMIVNRGCARGPMGMTDIVGMKTACDVYQYWGQTNNDAQMLANADYLRRHFLEQGKTGLQSGEGYYCYPQPAFAAADFLAVPDPSAVADIVKALQANK